MNLLFIHPSQLDEQDRAVNNCKCCMRSQALAILIGLEKDTPDELERNYWRIYRCHYSFRAIMVRSLASLSGPRADRINTLRDILLQILINAKIRNRDYLHSSGIARIR